MVVVQEKKRKASETIAQPIWGERLWERVASGVGPVASQKVNHLNNGNPPLRSFLWSHHHA
jgi:hypothetical protein